MAKKQKEPVIIRLKRDQPDRLLPKGFLETALQRCLPILSLTYVATILGIAAQKRQFIHFLFEDKTAYAMALVVVFWIAIPAVLWMLIRGNIVYRHMADFWYKFLAALMTMIMLFSYILFPEAEIYGLRIYFAATTPVFFVMYFFLIKGGLPTVAAYPLNAIGFTMLLYGAFISITHNIL